MTAEFVLAEMVRGWAESRFPNDPGAAALAALAAERAYSGGASVSEACERARHVLYSRSRHPSLTCDLSFPTGRSEAQQTEMQGGADDRVGLAS